MSQAKVVSIISKTDAHAIVNGMITPLAKKRITAALNDPALPAAFSSLSVSLEAVKLAAYVPVVVDGHVDEGLGIELVPHLCRGIAAANGKLLYAIGKADLDAAATDEFHTTYSSGYSRDPNGGIEVLAEGSRNKRGGVVTANNSASIASGRLTLLGIDTPYDGITGNDRFTPGVLASKRYIAAFKKVLGSVAAANPSECGWVLTGIEADAEKGQGKYDPLEEYNVWVVDQRIRQHEMLMEERAKADSRIPYTSFAYGPVKQNGLNFLVDDIEEIASAMNDQEALRLVGDFMTKDGINQDIGQEIAESAGRSKATGIIIAMAEGNWRGAVNAFKYIGLINQSASGVALIHQLVYSDEWRIEVAKKHKERMERQAEDAKRAHELEMAKLAAESASLRALQMEQRFSLLRSQALAAHEVDSARFHAETQQQLGRPLTQAQCKLLGVEYKKGE